MGRIAGVSCWPLLRCVEHAALLGGALRRAATATRRLSARRVPGSPERDSPYSSVDSERYSSLVKSVVSSRQRSPNPEALAEEDERIYGPVVKSQTAAATPGDRVPKIFHPFLSGRGTVPAASEPGPPTRVLLERGPGRSAVPSVTRILQQTMSPEQRFHLQRWKKRMVAELGEDGFEEYTKNIFRYGSLFHAAVEDVLASETTGRGADPAEAPGRPAEVEGYMKSISGVMEEVDGVRAIESTVQHGKLNYLGIVDCVARYRGVLCVIEWKTSEKPKPYLSNTYDNPLQVAAYAGALNNDDNYKYQVENGLIVVAYKDGSPAHAHLLHLEQILEYWKRWLVRLEKFTEQT
ncbi:mitochondrial genome maintenance exonuclease 1 [Lampris incognitus]|uniref:mitochondrial genome maintenance exonuclease 1 n=1 Tax=Lampris incognitus TaxID=2546036 RepID=UPI0024B4987E|nr:mitochondrial genome maintenance exonuclease 1 [Lampris incognitus]XP_056148086.1 mitochondrial genome maintenance exonuclease 1 [Lampris incognitus]